MRPDTERHNDSLRKQRPAEEALARAVAYIVLKASRHVRRHLQNNMFRMSRKCPRRNAHTHQTEVVMYTQKAARLVRSTVTKRMKYCDAHGFRASSATTRCFPRSHVHRAHVLESARCEWQDALGKKHIAQPAPSRIECTAIHRSVYAHDVHDLCPRLDLTGEMGPSIEKQTRGPQH